MADKREEVNNRLQEQQDKLSQLEEKLQQLLRGSGCSDRRRSNDSGTITWSDEETNTIKVRYFGKRQISSLKVTSSGGKFFIWKHSESLNSATFLLITYVELFYLSFISVILY